MSGDIAELLQQLFFTIFGLGLGLGIIYLMVKFMPEHVEKLPNSPYEQKRARIFADIAHSRGLKFFRRPPEKLQGEHRYFEATGARSCFNVAVGTYQGHKVFVHEGLRTYEGDGNNSYTVNTLYALTPLSGWYPNLRLEPEHGRERSNDIDLDNLEFSRRYQVWSDSRKLAYDVLHPRMMEVMLGMRKIQFSMYGRTLSLKIRRDDKRVNPARMGQMLDQLVQIRELVPNFVLEDPGRYTDVPEKLGKRDPRCSQCHELLEYIDEYERWYCYDCDRYAAKDT